MTKSAALSSIHPFESERGRHLFVANGSRIYDVEQKLAAEIDNLSDADEATITSFLARYGLDANPYVNDAALVDPPIRSMSLAVAQTCNLSCTYCYAQGGEFGGIAKNMSWPIARDAVLRLLASTERDDRVNISFLGGEPLVNRTLIRQVTEFAAAEARARRVRIGFSISTNGTLLEESDGEFFNAHRFAVTVSLDGKGAMHDRQRRFRNGKGSYQRVVDRVTPLLQKQQRMSISARVTVTPLNLCLSDVLDELIGLGFTAVGFSPMLSAPSRQLEMKASDLQLMLDEMLICGRKFEAEIVAGRDYPFSNITDALLQIHRGTHRPYPCGAGAGYLGVSAEGGLFACHRFVEDPVGHMGDVADGPDPIRRTAWLNARHVHRQQPCRSCWARYLCGGGCHHEVINRGRPACDFIRGWLHYCLTAYVNVMERRPDLFPA
jgi:uncharacterized protein